MKPYKAVVCALNSRYVHVALAPLCLQAGVRRAFGADSVSFAIVEGTVNEPQTAILDRIEREAPDLLGLSCYIWNIKEMLSLALAYKEEHPDVRIVLGGPEVSYRSGTLLMEHLYIDYVLSGEGESTFPRLIRAQMGELSLSEVPSLSYREEDGSLVIREPYVGTGDPPDPYRGVDLTSLQDRIVYLESSRGCPYRCTFCLSGRCGGVRYFDMERVKADLLHLAENHVRVIKFVDRTFNADRAYAHSLWRWIKENYGAGIPVGTRIHFEISGERLDEESFAILAGMPPGAIQLEVGLQSFHEETLRAIHRNPRTEELEKKIARLAELKNIHTHIDLIAGLPHEDYASFVCGFDRAYRLGANMLQLGFLKLLPGAPMTDEGSDRYNCTYSAEPPYEVIETPYITRDELDKLRVAEDALERLANSGRFRRTLHYLIDEQGNSPYALFFGFGSYVEENKISNGLDGYTEAFAEYAMGLPRVERDLLLDHLVRDRIATNSSGLIPEKIRNFDKRLKYARAFLNESALTAETKGIRRTLAMLRSENTILWVDYCDPDPVTGEYTVNEISADRIPCPSAEK